MSAVRAVACQGRGADGEVGEPGAGKRPGVGCSRRGGGLSLRAYRGSLAARRPDI